MFLWCPIALYAEPTCSYRLRVLMTHTNTLKPQSSKTNIPSKIYWKKSNEYAGLLSGKMNIAAGRCDEIRIQIDIRNQNPVIQTKPSHSSSLVAKINTFPQANQAPTRAYNVPLKQLKTLFLVGFCASCS
eukprot:Phypoly_transcript_21502.p2 GENE.Phypoly_transcript_21502~~Phypoly_transcript_21502.p2  ORF type:complete len:130 (-),score=10.71 Phypoly_transcript_21502:155-544(-)